MTLNEVIEEMRDMVKGYDEDCVPDEPEVKLRSWLAALEKFSGEADDND